MEPHLEEQAVLAEQVGVQAPQMLVKNMAAAQHSVELPAGEAV